MTAPRGIVYLVGAGPGAPGLITARGLDLLRVADVVVHDRLIGMELLTEARFDAEIINVGKAPREQSVSQDQINTLLLEHAKAGKLVVRLKGGDPFVFGRGFEEFAACREAGVDCEVIPGVTSAVAAPAAAGIPITDRRYVSGFAVISAHPPHDASPPPLNYQALAAMDTLIVMMGRENLDEVAQALISAGRDPSTPAACIQRATTRHQLVTVSTLGAIAAAAERDGLRPPIVTVIGEVAKLACGIGFRPVGSPVTHLCHPLSGKRMLITRPRSSSEALRRSLSAAGAIPICCPMIRIAAPPSYEALDEAILRLERYNWVVFTSANGVRAFGKRLLAQGHDARALRSCKIAAVGPATASALLRYGLIADFIPTAYSGQALATELAARGGGGLGRILCPRSDIAPPDLPDRLRRNGASVDCVVAYQTVDAEWSPAVLGLIREGVDAAVFFSPSAVRRFAELRPELPGAAIVCIGPPTASAARQKGLSVNIVAAESTTEGLFKALTSLFT